MVGRRSIGQTESDARRFAAPGGASRPPSCCSGSGSKEAETRYRCRFRPRRRCCGGETWESFAAREEGTRPTPSKPYPCAWKCGEDSRRERWGAGEGARSTLAASHLLVSASRTLCDRYSGLSLRAPRLCGSFLLLVTAKDRLLTSSSTVRGHHDPSPFPRQIAASLRRRWKRVSSVAAGKQSTAAGPARLPADASAAA